MLPLIPLFLSDSIFSPIGILQTLSGLSLHASIVGNLHNKVLAREYRLALPEEKRPVEEMEKTRRALASYVKKG